MAEQKLSNSLQDYLEAIYLLGKERGFTHANKVAEFLSVAKSSVSWALKQLAERELVNYAPYEAISLTDKGQTAAARLAARHEDIKTFLTEVLAVNEAVAEENACRMEHVVDRDILKRMRLFMDFLERCPRAGVEWMKGFGHFCQQGQDRSLCPECVTGCLHKVRDNPESALASSPLAPDEPGPPSRNELTVQRLKAILNECGRQFSLAEQVVARVFIAGETHQTVEQLLTQARAEEPSITRAQVEQALGVLTELRIARPVRFRDHVVYEHFHPEAHHDHLYCVKCGDIVEFFDPRIEALQMEAARRADYRLLMHNMNIYGLCRPCIQRESQTRPITDCHDGELVQVAQITADDQTAQRLRNMGLMAGIVVQVLKAACPGDSVIVLVNNSRMMLDQETAAAVKVTPTDSMSVPEMMQKRGWGRNGAEPGRHRHGRGKNGGWRGAWRQTP